jgi:DNA-binding Lrp family transcriptional regulator
VISISEDLAQKLDDIKELLALSIVYDSNQNQAIQALHKIDYTSKEIANFVDLSPSTIRDRISDMRDKGIIDE